MNGGKLTGHYQEFIQVRIENKNNWSCEQFRSLCRTIKLVLKYCEHPVRSIRILCPSTTITQRQSLLMNETSYLSLAYVARPMTFKPTLRQPIAAQSSSQKHKLALRPLQHISQPTKTEGCYVVTLPTQDVFGYWKQ